jgi:hypothetical protein
VGRAGEVAVRVVAPALLAALACLVAVAPTRAADRVEQGASLAASGAQIPLEVALGLRIVAAPVRLDGSTGDPAKDEALRQRAQAMADSVRDTVLQRFVVEGLMQRIAGDEYVAKSSFTLFQSVPAGRVVLSIAVVPAQAPGERPPERAGVLVTGAADSLPVLYRDDRSLLKLILNGGVGAYSTSNPFFGHGDLFTQGNLAAAYPAGPGTTTWAESYIEPGIGGIARVADLPLYAYGSATYLVSASWGQDLYDRGFRHHGAWEQAYAGVVWDLPGKGNALNVSAGRQIYQLRQGFLISKIPGSTNLGPLAALWLGPRLAFDKTAIAELKLGRYNAEAILLEPTEFPGLETGTRLAGGTVGYNDGETIDAALSYLEVPRSRKSYLGPDGSVVATREGLRTYSPSLWFTRLFGVEGLWLKGEFAWQTHDDLDMRAYAYALWPGYRAEHLPWKPGISYRYAYFSGDDPSTTRYERYDPLLSGGQNNYVPGALVSSVLVNANMRGQRLTLTANPTDEVALTLEYSHYRAIEANNRGAIGPLQQLSSKDLAQEVDLFCNVYFGKHAYLQGVLAAAFPGAAIRDAVGGSAKTWYAAQISLYFFF